MTPYLGQITVFGGTFAPCGWAFCNGQLLWIADYSALFNLLGTTFGGDGQSTFGLPDLRGRLPLGISSTIPLGAVMGSEQVTINPSTMATHNHPALDQSNFGISAQPGNMVWASSSTGDPKYTTTLTTPTMMNNQAVSWIGSGQPHENLQPYTVLNFIIALEGVYPTQS